MFQEKDKLQSEKDELLDEAARLAGHHNPNQKIHHLENLKQKLVKEQEVCTQTEDVIFDTGITQNKVQTMEMPPVETCDVAKLEELKSPDAPAACCGSIKNLCGLNKEEFMSPPTTAPLLDISNKVPAITAPVQSIRIEESKATDVDLLKNESSGKLMSPSVPELSQGMRGTPFSSVDSGMDIASNSGSADYSIISVSSVDSLAALARETLKIVGATNQGVLENADLSGVNFEQNNDLKENVALMNPDRLPLSEKPNMNDMPSIAKDIHEEQDNGSPTATSETPEKKSDRQSFGENAKGIPFIDATPRVISPSEPTGLGDFSKVKGADPTMSPTLQVVRPDAIQVEASGHIEGVGSLLLDSDNKENTSPDSHENPLNE